MNNDPLKQFDLWLNDSINSNSLESNSFALSTVGKDLKPSIRLMLMKAFDNEGIIFFSSLNTTKTNQIKENSNVAALFSWLENERQVKIQGTVEKISNFKTFKYFLSLKKGTHINCWLDYSSKIIDSRTLIEKEFAKFRENFLKNGISIPKTFSGFKLKINKIEFWESDETKNYISYLYKLENNSWSIEKID